MDEKEPTQRTQPKKGEPIEIPVPTREQVERDFAKIMQPVPAKPARLSSLCPSCGSSLQRTPSTMTTMSFLATQSHYWAHLGPIAEAFRAARIETQIFNGSVPIPNDGRYVIIAGYGDLALVPASCKVALASHGIDMTYRDVDHGSYAGGRNRERVGLFLCPDRRSADLNLERYPDAQAVVIGSPRVESMRSLMGIGTSALGGNSVGSGEPEGEGFRADLLLSSTLDSRQEQVHDLAPVPTVVLAWHWDLGICPETRSAWAYYKPVIERLATTFRFVGHGHPRHEHLAREYAELGIEWEPDQGKAFARADLVVFDNTSAGYEAAALGIPVLAVDAPWYRAEVNHGLRFWDQIPGLWLMANRDQRGELGVVCDQWSRDGLGEAILEAVEDRARLQELRRSVVAEVFGPLDGQAAQRAVDALVDWSLACNTGGG